MRNGILREDEGWDLLVDGQDRTFRDVQENAYAAARVLKCANRGCLGKARNDSGRYAFGCIALKVGIGMPEDLTEQRYRANAAECMDRARTASTETVRAMFLQLAQQWLEMASDRFGLTGRNRDRLNAALDDFNDRQMKQ